MSDEDYYSVEEVAQILGVAKKTIINYIDRGRFPGAYKLDPLSLRSPYRIPCSDVEAFKKLQRGNNSP